MIRPRPRLSALACLVLVATAGNAATIRVPADQPTIQLGIDAAAESDTVLVACGSYEEHDIALKKDLTLLGEGGDPACVVIDGMGAGGVLRCDTLTAAARIEGLTLRGGHAGVGGNLYCNFASPVVVNCRFLDGTATQGGGIYVKTSSNPEFVDCLVAGNTASTGGGVYMNASCAPTFTSCTFAENAAFWGGGLNVAFNCAAILDRCIVAFSTQGNAVRCESGGLAALNCTAVFGNAGGDWVDCIAAEEGQAGNLSVDPQFCGAAGSGNYLLQSDSPCAAAQSPCGSDYGALPVGCAETATAPSSWGALKRRY